MLREKVLDFEVGMYEQNVIAYLVKEHPGLLNHIEFETKYCINCWYISHLALSQTFTHFVQRVHSPPVSMSMNTPRPQIHLQNV